MDMDIEKLIESVRLCGSTPKVDQCKQCAYWSGGDMSKCIPRMTTDAATALSTLQAENEKLRAELERIKEKNAGLALALLTECVPNPDCLGDDEWRAIRAELEQVKRERDSALKDLERLCRDDVGPCEMVICELCAYNSGVQCSSSDGRICDGYNVFNWKWRGQKED